MSALSTTQENQPDVPPCVAFGGGQQNSKAMTFTVYCNTLGDESDCGGYVDLCVYLDANFDGSKPGSEFRIHVFIDCQSKYLVFGDLGYSPGKFDDYESRVDPAMLPKIRSEVFAAQVLEDTAQALLDAIKTQFPDYRGWLFSIDEFKQAMSRGLGEVKN